MDTEKQYLPVYSTPPKDLIEGLERVYNLICQGWCKYTLAMDENTKTTVMLEDEHATNVCLIGAVCRACPRTTLKYDLSDIIANNLPVAYHRSIGRFNDSVETTKEDILRLVRYVKVKLKIEENHK